MMKYRARLVSLACFLTVVVFLSKADAAGVVATCNEASLNAALTGGGTVTFSCSGTIVLTTTIVISTNTTIDGTGQAITLSGDNKIRILHIISGASVSLVGLTLSGGSAQASQGGAIRSFGTLNVSICTFSNNTSDLGGAIFNSGGALTIVSSTFSGNFASSNGGAIYNHLSGISNITDSVFSGNDANAGGAIMNGIEARLDVARSTFTSNNASTQASAIYIADGATATITDSTFSANSSSGWGTISNGDGTATISNSTFVGNSAIFGGGAIFNIFGATTIFNCTLSGNISQNGGVLSQDIGPLTISNSILSDSSGECSGAITDGGYNLSADTSCGFSTPSSQQNVSAAQLNMSTLGSNGGTTQTIPPRPGSIAINAIPSGTNGCGTTVTTDQRGESRPRGAACEIGAYEVSQTAVGDGTEGSCTETSLITALGVAEFITFNCPIPTTITLTSAISIPSGLRTIDGAGQSITISGGNAVRILETGLFSWVLVRDLTFANGKSPFASPGAAINSSGSLIVANCSFIANAAPDTSGLAIYNFRGTLSVRNSTFYLNSGGAGTIAVDGGTTTIANSTFWSNGSGGPGSLLKTGGGTVTVSNSILYSPLGLECSGTISDGGYNLAKGTACNFTATGSMQNVTVQQLNLGSLANNAGSTQTILPTPGSIAVDRIPAGTNECGLSINADQRGIARPQHGKCDVGAVEVLYRVPPQLTSE